MSGPMEVVEVQQCEKHHEGGRLERCCYAAEVVRLRERAVLVDGMRETERKQLAAAKEDSLCRAKSAFQWYEDWKRVTDEADRLRSEVASLTAQLGEARESIKSAASAIIQARTLLKGMIESERVHPHECRNTFQKLGQWIMDQAKPTALAAIKAPKPEPKEVVLGIDPATVGGDVGATVYGYRRENGSLCITRIERAPKSQEKPNE